MENKIDDLYEYGTAEVRGGASGTIKIIEARRHKIEKNVQFVHAVYKGEKGWINTHKDWWNTFKPLNPEILPFNKEKETKA